MIEAYEPFCLADTVFFDTPARLDDAGSRFAISTRAAPTGWIRRTFQTWVELHPEGAQLPAQGWKVHVSACLDASEQVLEAAWRYCIDHGLTFKFLRSTAALKAANFKYADRGSSGKLLTLYPADEAALKTTLVELGDALKGYAGPYILSDLRWNVGPLYVRYGGFAERYCTGPDGERVLAIEAPDGRLVPDRRGPVFEPPAWVTLPDFLAGQWAARRAEMTAEALPYQVERALHFSNGGGVYVAIASDTGRRVVLKEARPFAGLDRYGIDAVARLEREWAALRRLEGLDVVPRALGRFMCWEHQFLVQEYVEGQSLYRERAIRHPLNYPELTGAQVADYTIWALGVLRQVQDALTAVHRRGLTYGDLNPANVIVRPDGRIVLLDFEQASDVDNPRPLGLGAPGFSSSTVPPGLPADRFALGCLQLSMFLPFTPLLQADPGKLDPLLDAVTRQFPVPAEFAVQVRTNLAPGLPATAQNAATPQWRDLDWGTLRDMLISGILATASPQRTDRLFPGDPQQFAYGGHTLAYGAAGVIFALAAAGADIPASILDWLTTAALKAPEPRVGLFDGLHGVAYALHHAGRTDDALHVLDRAIASLPDGPSLFSGQAGVGLNLLHFAHVTADPALIEQAARCAELVLSALDTSTTHPGGLMAGWSGSALFLLRMYEHSGDPRLLDGAAAALDRDLTKCQTMPGGAVHLREGSTVRPFLADGSAGVGLALAAIRAHRDEPRYAALVDGIYRACSGELVVEPGLFYGLAGMLAYRSLVMRPGDRDQLVALARRLEWYAVRYRGHPVFPGRMLLRLSADLATGSAGILLALLNVFAGETMAHPIPGVLPFPPSPF